MLIPHKATIYSGTATSTGNSRASPITTRFVREAIFFLDITDVSGSSPTLDVEINVYDPISDDWYLLATFSQKTEIGTDVGFVEYGLGDRISCDYTIDGVNPSFTFSLTASMKEEIP